jgi:hypothetical protein
MARPNSRQALIDYCLRKLGAPVIEINVDPEQIEDCVDDAFQMYNDYHSDGTLRTYLTHQMTDSDLTNGYITLDPRINYVSTLFPISNGFGQDAGMFDIRYQMALNDVSSMYQLVGDFAYYEQLKSYMSMLDMQLNGTPQVQFSRRQNRLYIWGDIKDGDIKLNDFIVAEVYMNLDPNEALSIYNDRFIKNYTTALIKQRWGGNLSKFEGVQLPGGVTLNGAAIYEQATGEIKELIDGMRLEGELPIDFAVG